MIVLYTQEEFESTLPATRRVMVAHDVIRQLPQLNVVTEREGIYCYCHLKFPDSLSKADVSAISDMSQLLPLTENCLVCALGALFIGHVRLFNHVGIRQPGIITDVSRSYTPGIN